MEGQKSIFGLGPSHSSGADDAELSLAHLKQLARYKNNWQKSTCYLYEPAIANEGQLKGSKLFTLAFQYQCICCPYTDSKVRLPSGLLRSGQG
jgi:hypothetical protein